MIRKIKRKISALTKRSKTGGTPRAAVKSPKVARGAAKAASPHSERARDRGTTPAIESGTTAAAARKRRRAERRSRS